MSSSNREILVLVRSKWISDEELEGLQQMLRISISPERFCIAHELVDRTRITCKTTRILRESRHYYLRPFRFLLNKN